ncbi:MAG: replication factor C large subunit [Candidatus Hodarchaeota archaeon]
MIKKLWIAKYAPRTAKEIAGNKAAVKELTDWILSWEKKPPKKRAILLHGPPGSGKTASVYAVANDLNHDVVELNASDKRSQAEISQIVGAAARERSLLGSGFRIILIDEIDGVSGREDKGGIGALIKIIKETRNPIVMSANNPWDMKLRTLRGYCQIVGYRRVMKSSIVALLGRICSLEGLEIESEALRLVAEKSGGDIRAAINNLEAIAEGKKRITVKDVGVLGYRDRKENIFNVLKALFSSRTFTDAIRAVNSVDVDHEMLLQWIAENAILHLSTPGERAEGYNAISRADIFLGRIKRHQKWNLLKYVYDLMSAGVALSIKGSYHWTRYQFPSWILKLSRTKGSRREVGQIAEKIKAKCHTSARRAVQDFLPFIKIILQNDAKQAAHLAEWFEFTKEDLDALNVEMKTKKVVQKKLPE